MRIRTIKPEFWSHPVLARLPDDVRLAAIGILSIADDEGYFLAEPALIRSDLWPFDDDSTRARRVLAQLSAVGYLSITGHPTHGQIGMVINFTKHQRIDRPSQSKIKAYYNSTSPRRVLDESSLLDQGSGIRDQVREQGGGSREDLFAALPEKTTTHTKPGPIFKSFTDWNIMHGRVFVSRDDRHEWEALYSHAGYEIMSEAHAALLRKLEQGKLIFFTAIKDYILTHYEEKTNGTAT